MEPHSSSFPPAPHLTLTAVVSGRAITFDEIGRPAVLTFCGPGSQHLVDDVVRAARRRVPLAEALCNANVADLRAVPRLLRKVPEIVMEQRYHEACKNISPGRDPADYLLILPDWEGEATRAFGFDNLDGTLGVAVLAAGGTVVDRWSGSDDARLGAALSRLFPSLVEG